MSEYAYLECKENGSNKFYSISLKSTVTKQVEVLVCYGRIGAERKTSSIHSVHTGISAAKIEADKLMQTKLKKGYKLVKRIQEKKEEIKKTRFEKIGLE